MHNVSAVALWPLEFMPQEVRAEWAAQREPAGRVPALHHVDAVLLVGNNSQLGQSLKKVVTLQNKVSLKKQSSLVVTTIQTSLIVAFSKS